MKQTAVDWLVKIYLQTNKIDNFDIEQAKAMEKEQIMLSHLMGFMDIDGKKTEEQYYNETYGVKE